jgi:hypothetical protein
MAKKNETTQKKKVSKWDVAPKSIKDLYFAIGGVFDGLSSIIDQEEADNEDKALIDLLARVLDDYNELEAKHQKECGMMSEYEEELSECKEDNKQIKADLEEQVSITEALRELRDECLSHWMVANEKLGKLRTLLAAVDVTASYENNDNDGVGNWTVCNNLVKKNLELEDERYRYELELNRALENIEAALGIQRVHLTSSYGDRADYIIKKIKEDRTIYSLNKIIERSNYGFCDRNCNGPETLESLKTFLKDEYKFDAIFLYTCPDDGYWTLVQRGPNVFNRKSNNFRWAFRGAMECLGMSPGAIAAEIRWTSNSKVTPTDISAKWSQRACEIYDKGEEK